MSDQQDTNDRNIFSDVEITWSDHAAILTILTIGGQDGEQVHLDADDARAIGQALMRAADGPRRQPGDAAVVTWKSVHFTVRQFDDVDPWADEGDEDA